MLIKNALSFFACLLVCYVFTIISAELIGLLEGKLIPSTDGMKDSMKPVFFHGFAVISALFVFADHIADKSTK